MVTRSKYGAVMSKACIPHGVVSLHDRQGSGPQGRFCEPLDPGYRFTPRELGAYSSDLASQPDEPAQVVSRAHLTARGPVPSRPGHYQG